MEQIPLSPEVINEPFEVSVDFVMRNKEMIVDFFGDNRHWYKKFTKDNTDKSYDISTSKTPMKKIDLRILCGFTMKKLLL